MTDTPQPGVRQGRINRQLAATFVASFTAGGFGGAAVAFAEEGGPIFYTVAAIAAGAALVVGWYGFGIMMRYWRGIDELARDAHKTAWFWGGSAGLLVGLLPLLVVRFSPLHVGMSEAESTAFINGGAFVATAMLLGYLVFWAGFWIRARR